jgi:hypothetical protein
MEEERKNQLDAILRERSLATVLRWLAELCSRDATQIREDNEKPEGFTDEDQKEWTSWVRMARELENLSRKAAELEAR